VPWPTWDQAALAAAISAVIWLVVRTVPSRVTPHVEPVAAEFALIASLYSIWRIARMLPIASTHEAIARGRDIAAFEHDVHLPSELSLQHFVLRHVHIADFTSWYYATVHVPALIAFLVWLFFRHRDKYPHWRNGLALVTAWCLVIRFIRVAPPRFLPDLGYVDLAGHYGVSVYPTNPDVGVSDQFAAMPSIHIAWAAVVSLGIVAASTSRWRWVFLLHLVLTFLVVSATGNHWWLDGIVAVGLLAGSLAADTAVRAYAVRRSADRAVARPELSPEGLLVRLAEPGQGQ
jgi:PAP2 superfamily protein